MTRDICSGTLRSMHWPGLRVTVTGGAGFLGRVVCGKLRQRGCRHIDVPRSDNYDLRREADVARMYHDLRPDVVLHLAARVGGIGANRAHPAGFFHDNLMMGAHLIEQGRRAGLEKFVLIGTVCSYPKDTPVPFREDGLWTGYPEETNAPYGIAKKALMVMLDAYHHEHGFPGVTLLPVNLYGPGDHFDLETSHVVPALIRKCVEAVEAGDESITCWGTGSASREFLYVDDAAEGVLRGAERLTDPTPVNLGSGREITIRELAQLIARLTGFRGRIEWDVRKPDGQPRRCLDVTRARERLGFEARTALEEGLTRTIEWYRRAREVGKV